MKYLKETHQKSQRNLSTISSKRIKFL